MSRTAVAREPQEIYDELSQDEQDSYDRIAATGYKPEPAGRGWKAVNANGDTIGPCPTLGELESETLMPIAENSTSDEGENQETLETEGTDSPTEKGGKVHKITEDPEGNRYLEGMEPVVDSEIASAAGEYHAYKTDRVNLLNKETQAKEKLVDICHRKRHLFKSDPDNTNAKIYKCGSLVIRMENEVKEKISTEVSKDKKK